LKRLEPNAQHESLPDQMGKIISSGEEIDPVVRGKKKRREYPQRIFFGVKLRALIVQNLRRDQVSLSLAASVKKNMGPFRG